MKKFIIAATLMLFAGWAHAADLGWQSTTDWLRHHLSTYGNGR